MKKSLLTVSALLIAISVAFTACGKEQITFKDRNGKNHTVVTDKDGNIPQDEYGNLYEIVSDKDGQTKTQAYPFPEMITNKNNTYVENGALRMDLPHGWYNSGITSEMKIWHAGNCTNSGTPKCEISFSYTISLTTDVLYDNYLKDIYRLFEISAADSLNVYEKELLGLKAKTVYYKLIDSDVSCYCFFIQNGISAIQIEVYTNDDCYKEDQLIAMLNANCTLKTFSDKEPETTTTTTTTTAAEKTSAEATAAKTAE